MESLRLGIEDLLRQTGGSSEIILPDFRQDLMTQAPNKLVWKLTCGFRDTWNAISAMERRRSAPKWAKTNRLLHPQYCSLPKLASSICCSLRGDSCLDAVDFIMLICRLIIPSNSSKKSQQQRSCQKFHRMIKTTISTRRRLRHLESLSGTGRLPRQSHNRRLSTSGFLQPPKKRKFQTWFLDFPRSQIILSTNMS